MFYMLRYAVFFAIMSYVVGATKTLDHGSRFLWIKGTLQQGGQVMKTGVLNLRLPLFVAEAFSPTIYNLAKPSHGHFALGE